MTQRRSKSTVHHSRVHGPPFHGTPKLSLDFVSSHGKWQMVTYIFQVDGLESRCGECCRGVPKAAMELFPKGTVFEAGERGGGGVWREGGEEERGRRGGGLCLEETFWAPVPRRNPSGARLVPFGDLCQRSPVARSALRTTITGKDGGDSQRVNRVIQACGTHCHYCYVWT